MIWLLFALAGALFDSLYSATSKKLLKQANVFVIGSGAMFSSFVILIIVSFVVGFPAITDPMFIYYVIGSAFLDMIGISLFLKAIQSSDISLVLPFSSFTLVFLIIISFFVLGELPSAAGIAGIVLIFAGSYIINLKAGSGLNPSTGSTALSGFKLSSPLRDMARNRGIMYMMLFTIIAAFVVTINKLFIIGSDQFFGPAINSFFIGVFFLAAAILSGESVLLHYKKSGHKLFLLGSLNAVMRMFIATALLLQIAPYVISLKRFSIIFGVVWGYLMFKERGAVYRFWGAVIMLLGIILISVF
jgi:drug/metabolite transporter (DMT)-like permease